MAQRFRKGNYDIKTVKCCFRPHPRFSRVIRNLLVCAGLSVIPCGLQVVELLRTGLPRGTTRRPRLTSPDVSLGKIRLIESYDCFA